MLKNILLSGPPRSGKSTILKYIASLEKYSSKVGLVTHEVRDVQQRTGFEMETHSGDRLVLADVNVPSPYIVSRYHVFPDNLKEMIPKVSSFQEGDFLYLDEIGQMQLYCPPFEDLARSYLNAPNVCLAAVSSVYPHPFIDEINTRSDVVRVMIGDDREGVVRLVQGLIEKIYKAKKYVREPSRFTIDRDFAVVEGDHATRTLHPNGTSWSCDCGFFSTYKICSHRIALEELISGSECQ